MCLCVGVLTVLCICVVFWCWELLHNKTGRIFQIFHTMASEDGVDVESGTYGIWNLMVLNVQHQDECQALGA